jgi:predicted MPP superfamily phosphohydrolase
MQWVFLSVFILLLGLLNAGAVCLISRGFPPKERSNAVRTVRFLIVVLLTLAPVLARVLDREHCAMSARIVMAVSDTWIAILFWLYCLAIPAGIWNLIVRLCRGSCPATGDWSIRASAFIRVAWIVIVMLLVWGTFEASSVRVRAVELATPRLSSAARPLRIVQLSDIHLSLLSNRRQVDTAMKIVRELKPDMIVVTGDTVDTPQARRLKLLHVLSQLEAPLGKFAVLGNHEYYSGFSDSLLALREAGFIVLRDRAALIGAGPHTLRVVGFDDPARQEFDGRRPSLEGALLPSGEARPFTVVLRHRPSTPPAQIGRFDLQLSGHTHGGQIQPFGLIVRLLYPLSHGLHELGKGSWLYVSRGLGTWGPSIRFLARPEVTLFVIVPAPVPHQNGPSSP